MVEPVERRSLVDSLTNRLREEILSGKYGQGTTLPPERNLADALKVNRTSLKHALMKLEQLGLIAIRHGIGSVVLDPQETAGAELISHLIFRAAGIDAAMLGDLIEARTLMGGFLARLAAERRSDADLMRLNELLAQLADQTTEAGEVQRLELDFFRTLVGATGNRAFALLANSMFAVYRSQDVAFRGAFDDPRAVVRSLEAIGRAIDDADPEAAEHAALTYLRGNGSRMLAAVTQNRGEQS